MKGEPNGSILEKFGIVVTHNMWKINNNNKIAPSSKCSNVILIAQNATTRNP
jgi:hypothetical protein